MWGMSWRWLSLQMRQMGGIKIVAAVLDPECNIGVEMPLSFMAKAHLAACIAMMSTPVGFTVRLVAVNGRPSIVHSPPGFLLPPQRGAKSACFPASDSANAGRAACCAMRMCSQMEPICTALPDPLDPLRNPYGRPTDPLQGSLAYI